VDYPCWCRAGGLAVCFCGLILRSSDVPGCGAFWVSYFMCRWSILGTLNYSFYP